MRPDPLDALDRWRETVIDRLGRCPECDRQLTANHVRFYQYRALATVTCPCGDYARDIEPNEREPAVLPRRI